MAREEISEDRFKKGAGRKVFVKHTTSSVSSFYVDKEGNGVVEARYRKVRETTDLSPSKIKYYMYSQNDEVIKLTSDNLIELSRR